MALGDGLDIKEEQKKLYNEYKKKLLELNKVKREKDAVGQVFSKGLLPICVLHVLTLGPTNGNEVSHKIAAITNGLWVPSTGGIYPILSKLEKSGMIVGTWDNPDKKIQKIYTITEIGLSEYSLKKSLMKPKINEALEIFQMIFQELYTD